MRSNYSRILLFLQIKKSLSITVSSCWNAINIKRYMPQAGKTYLNQTNLSFKKNLNLKTKKRKEEKK